jgi:uncharacterized protein (DUF1697 family)
MSAVHTYIALLRGINVAGHKRVQMADLRGLLTQLGFTDVQSVLQSGNLLLRSEKRSTRQLEQLLEAEAAKRIGLETEFMVRTAKEWAAVIAGNPFPKEAKRDPARLLVQFLKDAPRAESVEALRAAITGPEVMHVDGRHAYIVYPDGVGRSRLTTALIESKLGTRGTGRNWNTVLRLGRLASEGGVP